MRERRVTLIVHRVAQIDNLDKDLPWKKDRADFYALVWIGDQSFRTKNFSKDDGRPYWTLTAFTNTNIVPVRIRLLDDDGGFENRDDPVNVNRMPDQKELMFWYDVRSGKVWGDLNGHARQMLASYGEGPGLRGRIWFTIE